MNETKRLTNADLAKIKKRAEAATGVEWDYDVVDGGISDGNFMVAMGVLDAEGYPVIKAKEADLEFIAHTRQDVPKLLAEVERLRELISEVASEINVYSDEEWTVYEKLKEAIRND